MSQASDAGPAVEGTRALATAFERIQQGGRGYHFVLLRETPLDEAAIDAGDVDLLGGRADVAALLAHLDELCRELPIHLSIERTGPRKTRVTLLSSELRHTLHFDCWTDLWQLEAGRRSLRIGDVAALCSGAGGLQRMPARLEAAVYLEHLRAKRRTPTRPGVRERLDFYASALTRSATAGEDAHFAQALQALAEQPTDVLPEALLAHAGRILDEQLGPMPGWRAAWRRVEDRVRRGLAQRLAPPRAAAVALVGADGIGKSSLGRALVANDPGWHEYLLGKALYRRSLPFRAIYKLNRLLGAPLSQERIDEWLAGLAYLAALVRLRRRLASGDPGLMIDRYLADFLYVGRKADRARFSRWVWLAAASYVSLPVVHLTAPHAVLSERKQEISAEGLRRFDRDMTRFYGSRPWVRYLRYTNSGSLETATRALQGHLRPLATTEGG